MGAERRDRLLSRLHPERPTAAMAPAAPGPRVSPCARPAAPRARPSNGPTQDRRLGAGSRPERDDVARRSRVIGHARRRRSRGSSAPWPRRSGARHRDGRRPRTVSRKRIERPTAAEGAVHHAQSGASGSPAIATAPGRLLSTVIAQRSPAVQRSRRMAGASRGAANWRKRLRDLSVGCALEGHDQLRRLGRDSPSARRRTPAGGGAQRSNSASSPSKRKANQTCFWPLPAAHRLRAAVARAGSRRRPSRRCAPDGDAARAGLLGQLAPGRRLQILAGIDAALRELPVVRAGRVGAAAEPDAAVRMEQDDADVRAIVAKVLASSSLSGGQAPRPGRAG